VDSGVVEPSGCRPILDNELDFEPGKKDLVEHSDDEFVLTDG